MAETESRLDLAENPTASGEADDFSTPDERKDTREKNHEIALLRQEQGPIGRLIGCSDSALTIAFILLALGAIGILASAIGVAYSPDAFEGIVEKLITFELTIAGYVMGKKSS